MVALRQRTRHDALLELQGERGLRTERILELQDELSV